jgi:hypothetical protein
VSVKTGRNQNKTKTSRILPHDGAPSGAQKEPSFPWKLWNSGANDGFRSQDDSSAAEQRRRKGGGGCGIRWQTQCDAPCLGPGESSLEVKEFHARLRAASVSCAPPSLRPRCASQRAPSCGLADQPASSLSYSPPPHSRLTRYSWW